MSKKKVIYVKETTVGSIVEDIFSFGCIVGSFWFNYKFIGGNDALDLLLFVVFFMFGVGRAANIRKLKEIEKAEL